MAQAKKLISFGVGPSQLFPGAKHAFDEAFNNGFVEASHRDPWFSDVCHSAVLGFANLLNLPPDYRVFLLSSGTEAMDVAIKNCVIRKSGHIVNGAFSDRWFKTAEQLGRQPVEYKVKEGDYINLANVEFEDIDKAPFEAICFTHNETSTGVTIPLHGLPELRERYKGALIMMDMVSSAPVIRCDFSLVDVAFVSVQKAFGLPPGLAFMVVGPRAMKKAKTVEESMGGIPEYRLFSTLEKFMHKFQTPETPNMAAIWAADKVVKKMNEIGHEELYRKVDLHAQKLYAFGDASEVFKPFVTDPLARSLTTLVMDVQGGSGPVIEYFRQNGIFIPGGYGKFSGGHIRIGNMPAHADTDINKLYLCLKEAEAKFAVTA